MTTQTQQFESVSQKERWVKYGANVALTVIVVIVLAIALSYLARLYDVRKDTTAAGLYSLKPQTENVLKNLDQKIKLVSLYAAKDDKQKPSTYAGPVRDLLEEYASTSKNIEYQAIDPVTQSTDALVSEAITKYGGGVKKYKDFIDDFNKNAYVNLKKLTDNEAAAVADVQSDNLGEDERGQTLAAIVNTVRDSIPQSVQRIKEETDRSLRAKFPDYKTIADNIKDSLDGVSQREATISKLAAQFKNDKAVPPDVVKYLADCGPRLDAIKKFADDTAKQIDSLGELKVSELLQAFKGQDLIIVEGDTDWRVINADQVWTSDTRDVKNFTEGQEIKPRFAGEQAVTTAILSLSQSTKPKVAFIRPGGPPLTSPGMPPFQRGGPLSELGERLRAYNFDVMEKDITGMYAMQAQMQGQQAEPEPTDDQIKDALWIVIDVPSEQGAGPQPTVAAKLIEHLQNGGSAMILAMPQSDNLSDALKDYGIRIQSDAVIIHEVPQTAADRTTDWAKEVQRVPIVFVTNKYGDHPLTAPLDSLDALLASPVPIKIDPVPGVKQTPLLPIPEGMKTWATHDLENASDPSIKFNPQTDLSPPFFTGAAAEKGKSRVVVFGTLESFTNQVLEWPDSDMLKRGVLVARFPGNSELFNDAAFWLAHMEPMIAISPSAMQVSRISSMSDATLTGWRVGVLLILLPGLVLAAGIAMYFARRD